MNLRVFYLYKTVGFGWLLFMCGRKRFKFEVEKIVMGRGICIEVREKTCNFWHIGQVFSSLSP